MFQPSWSNQGNDHRWTAAWSTKLLYPSFSKSFRSADEDSWKSMLQMVHKNSWETYREKQLEVATITGMSLGDKPMQDPGYIEDTIFDALKDDVSNLPQRTKYGRR